ncbi:MAG: hypothetical protein H6620_05955 [Halobacteriovoraceae bacterium]|nr:hypothetical protein [Halobacteriovoraceae bacterium]
MKLLTMVSLVGFLAFSSCSHFGSGHCCKDKEACAAKKAKCKNGEKCSAKKMQESKMEEKKK